MSLQQLGVAPHAGGRGPWVSAAFQEGRRLRSPFNRSPVRRRPHLGAPESERPPSGRSFPLSHERDLALTGSANQRHGGPPRGSSGRPLPQSRSLQHLAAEGFPPFTEPRGPWRPSHSRGPPQGSHVSLHPYPSAGVGLASAVVGAAAAGAAQAMEAPAEQPAFEEIPAVVGPSAADWAAPLPRSTSPSSFGLRRRQFEWPPTGSEASGLRPGQHVEASCLRVWGRYALLRLAALPPREEAQHRRSQGPIGFLHASGLRRGGRPLNRAELEKADLTKLLSGEATVTVELVAAPTAATSHRWQLALHLLTPPGPPSELRRAREGPSDPGAADTYDDESLSGGPLPEKGGPPAAPQEIWSGDDCDLLLAGEEDSFRGAFKGPSSGRRRRMSTGGPNEEQNKKQERPRDGTRRGGGASGCRRSGRDREQEEAEDGSFLVSEGSEEGLLFEEDEGSGSCATSHNSHAPPAPPQVQEPEKKFPANELGKARHPAAPAGGKASKVRAEAAAAKLAKRPLPPPALSEPRAAVVAVLGHVDHGKTTLLQALRRLGAAQIPGSRDSAAAQSRQKGQQQDEAGGITQRIGFFEVSTAEAARFPRRQGATLPSSQPAGLTDLQVQLPQKLAASSTSLTFLDTPGHAAFSCMRLRAAKAADLVLLVVASNEGMQEETRCCFQACKELDIPLVVVLTKTDLMGPSERRSSRQPLAGADFLATPEGGKVLGGLAGEGLVTEPLGGPIQVAAVNAKGFLTAEEEGFPRERGLGVDPYGMQHLLECIVLQAEMMGLQAAAEGPGKGIVLETHCSAAQGGSASLLLKTGTVKVGDWVVVGPSLGRIRRLRLGGRAAAQGHKAKSSCTAKPGAADVVEVFGFSAECLPKLGEEALVVDTEEQARTLQAWSAAQAAGLQALLVGSCVSSSAALLQTFLHAEDNGVAAAAAEQLHRQGLEWLYAVPRDEEVLPVVIRADAHGAAAAVAAAIEGLAAQRDSSGVWRLCSLNDISASFSQECPQAEDAEDNLVTEEEDDASSSSFTGSNESSTSDAPAAAIRRVRVLRAAAGECSSQDVHGCMDENKKGGLLIAFATKVSRDVKRIAAEKKVQLLQCDVIYDAIKAVETRLQASSLFALPVPRNTAAQATMGTLTARACVKQLFHLSNGVVVAGCDVLSGRLQRGHLVRILRAGGECVKEAVQVLSLKVGKEARNFVASPAQCGVVCGNFKDWQLGDLLIVEETP